MILPALFKRVAIFLIAFVFRSTSFRSNLRFPQSKYSQVYSVDDAIKSDIVADSVVSTARERLTSPIPRSMPFHDFDRSFIHYDDNQLLSPYDEAYPWSIELLTLEDVIEVSHLAVDCHYQSKFKMFSGVISDPTISDFFNSTDQNLKEKLRSKLLNSFLSRSYNRLSSPSLMLSKDSLILAARDKRKSNKIVGMVEIYPTKEVYLCNLTVAPEERGKGLGKLLCEICEVIALSRWKRNILCLHVGKENYTAQKLYESMRYKKQNRSFMDSLMLGEQNLIFYYKRLHNYSQDRA